MVFDVTEYYSVITGRASLLKALIENGTIAADPNWDLTQNFEAYFIPYYLTVITFNGVVSFLLHILVWYVMITKTPKEMKNYRIFLINISICAFFHDAQVSSIWRPIPLFPATAGFVQGPARILGPRSGHIGFIVCIFLVCTYITSIVIGLAYRMVSLMDKYYYDMFMSRTGMAVNGIFQFSLGFMLCTMLAVSYCPTDVIRDITVAKFPQLEPIFDSEYVFGYDIEYNPMLFYFFLVALFFIAVVMPLTGGTCVISIAYQLQRMKHSISPKNYKLHMNLLIALSLQFVLPMIMILIPDVFIIFGAWKKWPYINILAELTMMSCSMHSVLDNLITLVIVTPYRKAIISMVWKPKESMTAPASSTMFSSKQRF